MTSVSVLIPYYPTTPRRKELFNWVFARWQHFFPDYEYCIGSSSGPEFDRSLSRNKAFRSSSGDIVILADADTIPEPQFVEQAIDLVETTGTWVLPYSDRDYYNLDHEYSDLVIALPSHFALRQADLHRDHKLESWAGIQVMPRAAFLEVGGYDERFRGWGYEDNAFRLALDTLWKPHQRIQDGYICHLWHEAPEDQRFGQPDIKYNQGLFNQYCRAYGDAVLMRSVKGPPLRESDRRRSG